MKAQENITLPKSLLDDVYIWDTPRSLEMLLRLFKPALYDTSRKKDMNRCTRIINAGKRMEDTGDVNPLAGRDTLKYRTDYAHWVDRAWEAFDKLKNAPNREGREKYGSYTLGKKCTDYFGKFIAAVEPYFKCRAGTTDGGGHMEAMKFLLSDEKTWLKAPKDHGPDRSGDLATEPEQPDLPILPIPMPEPQFTPLTDELYDKCAQLAGKSSALICYAKAEGHLNGTDVSDESMMTAAHMLNDVQLGIVDFLVRLEKNGDIQSLERILSIDGALMRAAHKTQLDLEVLLCRQQ